MTALGRLVPDPHVAGWLVSQPVLVPLLGTRVPFVLEDVAEDPRSSEFERAVTQILALERSTREDVAPHVFKNYRDMVDAVGDEADLGLASPGEVWTHVRPTAVHVSRRAYGDQLVYVAIYASCAWEQEHGLQIVYREGRQLVRVSEQDGHLTYCDAYGLPESEDRIS